MEISRTIFSICLIFLQVAEKGYGQDLEKMGRIQAFDKVLMLHFKLLSERKDLAKVRQGLSVELETLHNPDQRMVDYYFDVVNGLEEQGEDFIINERDRFHVMMSSAPKTEYGKKEEEYALQRRNILEAFIDSMAQYFLQNMDFPDPQMLDKPGTYEFSEIETKVKKKKKKQKKTDL